MTHNTAQALKTLLCAATLTGVAVATSVSAAGVAQPPAPSVTTETATIHMSFPEKGEPWLGSAERKAAVQLRSDEYWFRVSGKELSRGIGLDFSHPGALVRLTALKNNGGRSAPINLKELALYQDNQKLNKAIVSLVTEEQLAEGTIFQGTAAFRLNEKMGTGQFQLRSGQRLVDDDLYIVNVKEKGSSQILHMASQKLTLFAGDTLKFSAQIKQKDEVLDDVSYKAYLLSPSGEEHSLSVLDNGDGQLQTLLPSSASSTRPGELYELYLNATAGEEAQRVRRTVKLPFAIASPTARFESVIPVMNGGVAATVHINVSSEGRYGLRGTLYGTDANGKLRSIMRSHSAYWLTAGGQSIDLAYDESILEKSSLQPPYKLKDLVLIDQGKLAVLHKQSQVD